MRNADRNKEEEEEEVDPKALRQKRFRAKILKKDEKKDSFPRPEPPRRIRRNRIEWQGRDWDYQEDLE